MSNHLRSAGTVREVVSPVVRWSAKVGDEKRDGTCDGELVVGSDDTSMRVTALGKDLRGESKRERMAWSELAARFNLGLGAIPPFTEASVDILEVTVGAEVVVVGDVTERAFAEDGGLRDAPTERASALNAIVVGIGDGAAGLVDRELAERSHVPEPATKKRAPSTPRWHQRLRRAAASMTAVEVADLILLTVVCVLLIVAGNIAHRSTNIRAPIGFACAIVACAIALRPGRALEPFRAREKVYGRDVHLTALARGVAFGFCAVMLVMQLGITTSALHSGPDSNGAQVIAIFGLGVMGILLIGEAVAQPTVGRLSTLGGREGIEGVLRAEKPDSLGKRAAALGRSELWHTHSSDGPNGRRVSHRITSARFVSAAKLTVETDDGELVIDPAEVAWASTIKFRYDKTSGGWEINRLVPTNERVVVHGTRDGTKLRSKGLSPVLVFAGPAAPRAWAARAVRWRYLSRAALVAGSAGLLWSSGWLG